MRKTSMLLAAVLFCVTARGDGRSPGLRAGHQGWIQIPFAAANFFPAQWTVRPDNVRYLAYKIVDGDTMTLAFSISRTSVPADGLGATFILLPQQFDVAIDEPAFGEGASLTNTCVINDAGTPTVGYAITVPKSEQFPFAAIEILRADGKPLSPSNGATFISGEITFPVK